MTASPITDAVVDELLERTRTGRGLPATVADLGVLGAVAAVLGDADEVAERRRNEAVP